MQTLLAATRNTPFSLGKRAFASSARSWQAVPQQKPTFMKEFKIYRWVRYNFHEHLFLLPICLEHVQNPDEPDKKPTLQSYQLDLNQTGPMVSGTETFSSFPVND